MPIFTSQNFEKTVSGEIKLSPARLAQNGPILDVVISFPQALAELYTKQNKTIPSPIAGIGLIDTGATKSCVDEAIMRRLGVNTIGVAALGTPTGQALHNRYPAHFFFPASGINIDFSDVIGVNLAGQQDIDGKPIVALIGRDVLSMGILIYNGHSGAFSIAIG